jgi:CBS domain-containing protein
MSDTQTREGEAMTTSEIHTSPLAAVTAREAMRPGVIGLRPRATLYEAAAAMTVHGTHAVAVDGTLLTDLDLLGAILRRPDAQLGTVHAEAVPVVSPQASLDDVAAVMQANAVRHVVVGDNGAVPAGVLSTFDLVAVLGGRDPAVARLVRPAPARPALSDWHLDRLRVRDCMHAGVVTCPPTLPLGAVAAALADHRMHCLVEVGLERLGEGERLVWAVVDAQDVVAAGRAWDAAATAAQLRRRDPVVVDEDATVEEAARLMDRRAAAHVVATDASGRPSGVLSTLDVAAIWSVGAYAQA